MFKVTIENLPNGNYYVQVIKDAKGVVIERSYQDLKDVLSLIPLVFLPTPKVQQPDDYPRHTLD
jgi:hypothetical protein